MSVMKWSRRSLAMVSVVAAVVIVVLGLYLAGVLPLFGTGNGSLNVLVHDAPCVSCAHVWVTFTAVAVHRSNSSGGGWTNLSVSGGTVDLMALNGTAMARSLGIVSLKAGQYEQVRITVSNVTVGMTSGAEVVATLMGPYANIDRAFTITAGGTTHLIVDIDLATSLHVTPGLGGGFNATFTPRVGSVVVTGS